MDTFSVVTATIVQIAAVMVCPADIPVIYKLII